MRIKQQFKCKRICELQSMNKIVKTLMTWYTWININQSRRGFRIRNGEEMREHSQRKSVFQAIDHNQVEKKTPKIFDSEFVRYGYLCKCTKALKFQNDEKIPNNERLLENGLWSSKEGWGKKRESKGGWGKRRESKGGWGKRRERAIRINCD